MAWFKVDDGFFSSRKVLSISKRNRLAAIGLWTLAGTWCAKELTDGVVPEYMIEELGGTQAAAEALVSATLWTREPHVFRFTNWAEYQPSRESVEHKRSADATRKADWRAKKATVRDVSQRDSVRSHGGTSASVTGLSPLPDPTHPDPTHPVPKGTQGEAARRGSRIPAEFTVDDLMRQWAKSKAPAVDVVSETENFVDYWRAKAGKDAVKVDWKATWQTWMRRAQGFRERDGWKPSAGFEIPEGQEWMGR